MKRHSRRDNLTSEHPAATITAKECSLTGAAAEVVPVVSLNGRPSGDGKPGPVTNDLLARFQKLTRN